LCQYSTSSIYNFLTELPEGDLLSEETEEASVRSIIGIVLRANKL
jgi:hypothetical protein